MEALRHNIDAGQYKMDAHPAYPIRSGHRSWIRIFNLISLDVAIGSVASAIMFARLLGVTVLPYGYAALGLTVWIIYTADHLLDAYSIGGKAISTRHAFHQRHFALLLFLMLMSSCAVLLLITMIRRPVLESGLWLSAVVVLYLIIQRKLTPLKEFAVGIIYSAGVLLPSLSQASAALGPGLIWVIAIFTCTTFLNLILFSWFGMNEDKLQRQFSIALSLGFRRTRTLLIAIFVVQLILILGALISGADRISVGILLGMNAVLFLIFAFPGWFSTEERYRLAGDGVFLIPLISAFLA
ncbi:MAG: hypothetical protein JST46_06695 [Bacteroidetes bacterium]|nr:hypothetical protein [Bacteroidota bacterium]